MPHVPPEKRPSVMRPTDSPSPLPMIAEVGALHLERLPVLSAVSAVLSNLVSNVPAVLVLKPFVVFVHLNVKIR